MADIESRKITTELQVDRCGLSNTLHGNMVQYGALDIPIKNLESRPENTHLENSRGNPPSRDLYTFCPAYEMLVAVRVRMDSVFMNANPPGRTIQL